MLPDGAEKQAEDWTTFFLNQTGFNSIAPVLALDTAEDGREGENDRPELLYVLNLVRTKMDTSVDRCVRYLQLSIHAESDWQRCRCPRDGDMHTASVHPDLQGASR